ncbi:tRNA/rRNA methyltransferase [Desulfocicer vacuolatum DSM 3385]|uniref:tRNA (cytidine/uridine-2'-O-)-methyltransferase TrmJ n=1 Tax=Desulfocicer vacuolatum DSM 3385 TaxID=1121400 RepID=A0A1W1YLQ6_9BACT|nr:RNA methyltransferase [Desulfocicer vacuolatum]SMC36731.1 tRNA/rRNA methyltransferase [Desulfocicer vacuolatum DSM 3385]
MKYDNLSVVLVAPQGPLNVGATCRTMMNFGFSDLRLVTPCTAYRGLEARKMALTAQPMLEKARVFDSLAHALADCHLAFGTTRRFGKYRNNFFTPDVAGTKIAQLDDSFKCALVLGREDNGLTTEELSLCQHFITIPTQDAFASMNLSHALTLFLYEIAKAMQSGQQHTVAQGRPATMKASEQMYAHMRKTLCDIEYLDPQNPDHLLRTFRRIFSRAGLRDRDVNIIRGLMSRIDWINKQRKK